jgi:hypothetical protein
VTLSAALPVGFTTITVDGDPIDSDGTTITASVEGWRGLHDPARHSAKDAEERRLPVAITVGTRRLQSGKHDREELMELFRGCARRT